MNIDDNILISRIQTSIDDAEAWEELYIKYRRYIIAIISSYETNNENKENLLQEVWLRMYKLFSTYDPKYKFTTWISLNTVNICNNWLKSKRRKTGNEKLIENMSESFDNNEISIEGSASKGFEDDLCNKELIIEAMKTITKVNELTAFKMRYINELSIQEIAEALNEKESVVKNWVYRTRDKISKYLIDHNIKY